MSAQPETAKPTEEAEAPAPNAAATAAATTAATTAADTAADGDTDKYEYCHLDDLDLPPLRIHATNRLSASNFQIPPGIQQQISHQQKRYSLDSKVSHLSASMGGSPTAGSATSSIASSGFRGRSRSRSPSLRSGKDRATTTTQDGNSSFSSLEEFVDPDILYDKMGFVELDMKEQKKQQQLLHHQHSHSYTFGENLGSGSSTPINTRTINLTPVSERLSEDTLEDVHAFSDLSANTNTRPSSSVGGSTVGGEVSSHILEPLDEGDEDDLESEEDADHHHLSSDGGPAQGPAQIILTNMENITLQDNNNHDIDNIDDNFGDIGISGT